MPSVALAGWRYDHIRVQDTRSASLTNASPRWLTLVSFLPMQILARLTIVPLYQAALHAGLALLVLVGMTLAPVAQADQDHIQKREFLEDPSGFLTIDQVAQSTDFRPVNGPLSRGYTSHAIWLRLTIAPSDHLNLTLVVQTSYLDDLQLYSLTMTKPGWTMQQRGDRFPRSNTAMTEVNPAFRIYPDPHEPTIHYLRIKTTSASLVHVRALSASDSMAFDTFLHATISGYIGLISVLLVFALICWRLTRDSLWAFDALLQFSTISFTAFNMGFAGKYLLADAPWVADTGVSVITCLQVGIASLFFWRLFKAYNAPGWTTWLYRLSLLLLPVLLALIALGEPQLAVKTNANLLLLQTLLGGVIIWFVQIEDALQRHLVRFTYIALVIYLMFYTLPLVGLTEATEFNLYPALFGNLFTAIMLQVVLARRTQLQLRERWNFQLAAVEATEKLKGETHRREAATSFLSMLMHEIKNPLTSIRVASQSLASGRVEDPAEQVNKLRNIQKSVEGIDTVLERCVEADRLEQGALAVHKERHDAAALLADWVATDAQRARIQLQRPDALAATLDAPLLCLLVRNLLSNALTYSPPDSTVQLTLAAHDLPTPAGNAPSFSITFSNGVGRAGVPDPDRVFQKYYRAPGARHSSGTGLGLYWVRSVTQLLGGTVTYTQQGDQVVFELWLPR